MVVTLVVVGADLLHVLGPCVEERIAEESEDDEAAQGECKCEACPIVTALKDRESIPIEAHLPFHVHLAECVDRDFVVVAPFRLLGFGVEGEVV